jgi:UrcA family protein
MSRISITLAATLFLALSAAPASAQIAGNYNDHQSYDLTRASDASFDARVRLAARQWCGQRMGRVSLREYLLVRACKREFIADVYAGADPTAGAY